MCLGLWELWWDGWWRGDWVASCPWRGVRKGRGRTRARARGRKEGDIKRCVEGNVEYAMRGVGLPEMRKVREYGEVSS